MKGSEDFSGMWSSVILYKRADVLEEHVGSITMTRASLLSCPRERQLYCIELHPPGPLVAAVALR
jgi:hypothetical protein